MHPNIQEEYNMQAQAQNEMIESFNWWQMIGVVASLVVLGLMPYIAWILKLIFA
jgi:hypothetical protein